jgi:hypothetical protein
MNHFKPIIVLLLIYFVLFYGHTNAQSNNGQERQVYQKPCIQPKNDKHSYLVVVEVYYDSVNVANKEEILPHYFNPLTGGRDTIDLTKRIMKNFYLPEICQDVEIDQKFILKVSKDSTMQFQNVEVIKGRYCGHDISRSVKKILKLYPLFWQDKKFTYFYMILRFEYR